VAVASAGQMQVCTSLQTDNHASTSPLSFYRPDAFLPPNQQRQSTEGHIASTQLSTVENLLASDSRQTDRQTDGQRAAVTRPPATE